MYRNKAKPFFYYIITIIFLCFSTACGKEKLPDYDYEYTSYNLRVEEKDAIFVTSVQDVVIYHGGHANYYFDKNLSPELRDVYVTTSEQVVQFLVENVGFAGTLEVYAADGMYYYNPESGKCALGAEYAGTSVQVALLVQAATGSATTNYGLLQAEGFSMAKLFGWDISYVPPIVAANNKDFAHPLEGERYELQKADESQEGDLLEEISSILGEENDFLLDFEYLCFSPNYVAEEQVGYAWKLARSLSGYISANNKEQEVLRLLMRCDDFVSFEKEFVALKNVWLESVGSTVRVSAKEYPVHYGNYGRFAFFQMKTLHGNWYVKGDFDTGVTKNGKNSWVLRENYKDVNMRMQELENGMTNVDGILRHKSCAYPELNFYLGRNETGSSGVAGCYNPKQKDRINLKYLHAVVHEYCHYLMLQEGVFLENGSFKEEYNTQLHLLPHYYGMFGKIVYSFFQERYEVMKERLGKNGEWEYYFQKLEEKLGGEVLIHDKESMGQLMHFFAATSGMDIELLEVVLARGNDYHTEYEGILGSFSIYIADTYGEDVLYFVATGNDKVKELTGYTYEELAEEWEAYLEENYGE